MDEKTDVFIPVIPKDLTQLEFAVRSLVKFVKNIGDIHICSPQAVGADLGVPNVYFHTDFEVLPNPPLEKCRFRKNWIYQQLLKYFQNVTKSEYYLVFDSDSVLINDLDIFDGEGRPIQYVGAYQNHKPYFDFIGAFSRGGFGREYDGSFICDLGVFNRAYVNEMLGRFGFTEEQFIDFAFSSSSSVFHISEFETYGNYMEKFHRGLYRKRHIRQKEYRKDQFDPYERKWSADEIQEIVKSASPEDYDIIQIRSGCCNDNLVWTV